MKKIILIGAINKGKIATCGETIKNQLLLERFEEIYDKVITVDTINWRKRPWILIKLFMVLIFVRDAQIVLSASVSASYIISLLYYLPIRRDVYFWVIGGRLASLAQKGIFKIKALKKLKNIIVEGNSMIADLKSLGIENTIYVPNFKPITYTAEISKKNFTNEPLKFVFLSRVHPAKGIPEILEAAKRLDSENYSNKYIIDFYGAVELAFKDEFTRLISKHKNINYKGFLNLRENSGYEILTSYHCMLFPTYWDGEGFPGVIIDAYMSGLPVIASDWNMNKEIIKNGETGIIIPTHDSQALSNAMKLVINNSSTIEKMSVNCIRNAQCFDYKTIVSKEVLQKIGLF